MWHSTLELTMDASAISEITHIAGSCTISREERIKSSTVKTWHE